MARRGASSKVLVRRISAAPGRKASSEPVSARIARIIVSATCGSIGRASRPSIAGLDRKGAAFAGNHRRVAEQCGDARAVDGRRHDQDAQILAQALLHVAGQRQAEIGVERALMELVEDHGRDAVEHGIVEDEPGEDALGDDLDPGAARDFGAEPDEQTHGVADALAQRLRHALGGGARGEPAWLKDQIPARFLRPILAREHQRHPRRLAGAGRRHQDGRSVATQCRRQVRQGGIDRKR